jgi:DNA-binding Lrp family transcriptional regulator
MEAGNTPVHGTRVRLDATDAAIAAELERDGRATVTEIAERAGLGVSTVRRRLPGLLSSGTVMVHCDVSRQVSGSPVSAVYFASVPAVHLEKVTSSLRTLPGMRLCSVVAGPDNLVLDVWLESLRDVHQVESFISERLQSLDLRIADRAVALRTYKLHGRVLDAQGRAVAQ